MTDLIEPEWVTEAFTHAEQLARDANAFWSEQLGEPGMFGGFQVRPIGPRGAVLFQSMLFGGRQLTGDAEYVATNSRAYVLSRRRGKETA